MIEKFPLRGDNDWLLPIDSNTKMIIGGGSYGFYILDITKARNI